MLICWYLEEFITCPLAVPCRANRIERSLIQWGRDLYQAVAVTATAT
jgi:hypothetical protein